MDLGKLSRITDSYIAYSIPELRYNKINQPNGFPNKKMLIKMGLSSENATKIMRSYGSVREQYKDLIETSKNYESTVTIDTSEKSNSIPIFIEGKEYYVYINVKATKGAIKVMDNLELKGHGYGMSLQDIADKHRVTLESIKSEMNIGMEVEKEHSLEKEVRERISKDHLADDPKYYTHLSKQINKYESEIKDSITYKLV